MTGGTPTFGDAPKAGQWEPLAWVLELRGALFVENLKTVIKMD